MRRGADRDRDEPVTLHEELAHLLRPAGGGIHLISTGKAEQLALQRRLYRASSAEECARLIRFLLSEGSNYMTGQALNWTGGMVTW